MSALLHTLLYMLQRNVHVWARNVHIHVHGAGTGVFIVFLSCAAGVLAVACRCLLDCLGRLPGDARTMVGFVTYDSSLHFYNLSVSSTVHVQELLPEQVLYVSIHYY